MFDDIKNYADFAKTPKTCALCKNGRPLKTYTTCDGCGQYFCYNHRPLFTKQWFCPLCEQRFDEYIQPLKVSDVNGFIKKLFG